MNRAARRHPERQYRDRNLSDSPAGVRGTLTKAAELGRENANREQALLATGIRVDPAGFVERRVRALADVLELNEYQRADWELVYQELVATALDEAEAQATAFIEQARADAARRQLLDGIAEVPPTPRPMGMG